MIVLILGDAEKINRKCFRSLDQFIYISDIMLDKHEHFLTRSITGKSCLSLSVNLISKYIPKYFMNNQNLKIPLLMGNMAIHGNVVISKHGLESVYSFLLLMAA